MEESCSIRMQSRSWDICKAEVRKATCTHSSKLKYCGTVSAASSLTHHQGHMMDHLVASRDESWISLE
nr:hypothetical protein CFP56_03663 [Quercus suber]